MEAAATPLPREDTTPPVTKMYFGAARKALEFLRWIRRTRHYVRKRGVCQIASKNFSYKSSARQEAARSCRIFSTRWMSAGTSTLIAS
jgi:hypothetical protein